MLLNYFLPEKALSYLIYIVVSAAVLNWMMISLIHLKFRQSYEKTGHSNQVSSVICTVQQLFCFSVHADDFIHHVESGFYAFRVDASCVDPRVICFI